jgi:hypothetical protein
MICLASMNLNHDMLTPVGTFGWFAMLVMGPILRQQYVQILIPVVFSMLIIDTWAVIPVELRQNPSLKMELALWGAALFPYAVMLYWSYKVFFPSAKNTKAVHD